MQKVALKRMTVFIDESSHWKGKSLATALLERMHKEGIAGATVLRGSSGYGTHGQIHTTSIIDLATNLPIMVIAVDEPDKIEALHPMLDEMLKEGLVIIDDVVGYVPGRADASR
jgi:PII-like signaling protein